jgi:hypothetical protein
LKGNTVNTIPYSCRSQIPRGAAAASDSRPDSGTGGRLFEVNIWMCQYGRPFPRKFSVEDAIAMLKEEGAGIQGKKSCSSSAPAPGSRLKTGRDRQWHLSTDILSHILSDMQCNYISDRISDTISAMNVIDNGI